MRGLPIALLLMACAPPGGVVVGVSGAPLAGSLQVHVVADDVLVEGGILPIAGATVDVGGASVMTDSNGDATLATNASSVTLSVHRPGFVTERWIGVDHDRAVVALAAPITTRMVHGTITGGTADLSVSVTTILPMLRSQSTAMSTASCSGGSCAVSLGTNLAFGSVDVVTFDAHSARIARARLLDATSGFAFDVSTLPPVALASFDVTFPSSGGFAAVVGVPGVSAPNGVALLTPQTSSGTAMIPMHAGPFADETSLWYIVRATTADGHGESVVFDRSVGQTPGRVVLPDAFLAVPTASLGMNGVTISVDPMAALYVVETQGSAPTHTLVLQPSGAQIDVPIDRTGATSVTVRAVDARLVSSQALIDLGTAERTATRIATLTL